MKKDRFSLLLFFTSLILISAISYARQYFSDYNYPPATKIVRYCALLVISILFINYILFMNSQKKAVDFKFNYKFCIPVFLVGLYLASIYPLFSIDLYEYIIRGRMLGIYHANPYLHFPYEYPNDLFNMIPYAKIFWQAQAMIYGPLWTILVTIMSLIDIKSVFISLFSVKFMVYLFHLGASFYVFKIADSLNFKNAKFIAQAYLFNPFILLVAGVDGHLDTVMICFFVASIAALLKNRFYLAFFLMSLSILVKYFPVLFIPFYIFYMHSVLEKGPFFKKALISISILLATIAFFYMPFWSGISIFSSLKTVASMVESCSIPYIYYKLISLLVPNIPQQVFRYVCYGIFIAGYYFIFVLFLSSGDKKQRLVTSILLVFFLYILVGAFQLNPWHLVWIIPFIVLSKLPYKFTLMSLVSFAASIAFWKRISVLLIIVLSVYTLLIIATRKRTRETSFPT